MDDPTVDRLAVNDLAVNDLALTGSVQAFLNREARLLDARKWNAWLDLYSEDAVFWVPAVTMAGEYTTDAANELNFIYISGRAGLEARAFRVAGGGSLASNPLPRTRHLVGTVMIDAHGPQEIRAFANAQAVAFCEPRGQQILTSSYEYTLRRHEGDYRIAQKKILLLEYVIDGYFHFFTV